MKLQRNSSISDNLTMRYLASFDSIIRKSTYSLFSRVSDSASREKIVACLADDRSSNAAFMQRVLVFFAFNYYFIFMLCCMAYMVSTELIQIKKCFKIINSLK